MYTDMNTEMRGGSESVDPAADSRESELGWLLDMDLSEPQEKLFTVEQATSVDTSLTEYELEVARRPMTRGAIGADDLASYVDEEIVISSEAQGSDIYVSNSPAPSARNGRENQELMAIDFSRPSPADTVDPQLGLKEGLDILGLAEQDDIGEKFLVIKRPRSTDGSELDIAAMAAGGSAPTTVDEVPQSPAMLSDAPVLRLVKARAPQPVANDPTTDHVAARVAGLLPALMDELRTVVNERLAMLGLAMDSVRAELKMARDQSHADELSNQGFGPLVAICSRHLGTLQQLRQLDVDAMYLRLLDAGDGQLRNTLFDEDSVSTDPAAEYVEFDSPLEQLETFLSDMAADTAMASQDDTFTGEIAQPHALQWQGNDADIDEVFADFGASAATASGDEFIADPAASALAEFLDADSCDIFAEDFFADESLSGFGMVADTAEIAAGPQADIDELFESLGIETVEADEICGVGVGEFSAAAGHLQLVPPLEMAATAQSLAQAEAADGADFCCVPAGIVFAEASLGGGEIFSDFLDAFVEEGSSELEKLEDAVARWEKDLACDDAYAAVSRILHTIKGIAKGVGLQFYGTLIHNFETLLSALPRPRTGSEGDYFRIVNAWLDACVRGLDHIQDSRGDIPNTLPQGARPEPVAARESAVQSVVEAASEPAAAAPAPQPVSEANDVRARQLSKKMADEGARALAAQQSVRITSEKLDHLLNLSNQVQQLSVRTAQSVTRSKRSSSEMQGRLVSLRAHIAAIADRALRSVAAKGVQPGAPMDALEMDQYSELQEAANILREGVEDLADLVDFATRQNIQVEALLKQQTRVISSIGSAIRSARVVPVSRLMPGLRRLVRTLSVDLDKSVSFQVLNELGTLDRDDYARCQTILDHMVRNALDHGIEPAAERGAAGKPAEGLVTIDIRKAGADSVITLTDDGRGIDPEKMRESAIRKGLDLDVDALTDAEATRLIFHKGFSTASSVSQISGRGVGMDIVLTELQEMGGDIQINSVPGRGTSFHIRVPSSITVNGALLVSAGEHSYAIPLGGLIAVEQVPVAEFFAAVNDNTRLTVAGMECEPAYLATLCHTGHALDAKTWRTSVPVIVAGSPERYMAIAIDDVEEALELVIRSLGPQFSTVPGVAGAATTAAGEAIVALDLNLLVASVPAGGRSTLHVDTPREENLLVMVVDDSRTQRMVATSQLETVGVDTITAENGAVAIDLLNTAERLPDIILMDVEMPVKDGIQALREIRKSVRFGHIPVIMITSRTGLKHRAMAQAAGCNGYMGKPFNFRMLIGQVNELTGYRLQLS